MKGFFGKVIIGLAVLCAVGSARPASAQTFEQQIAYLRTNILNAWGGCFKCDGQQTILNLLNGAQAAHNAGDTARCMLIIDAAINCANAPSREVGPIAAFILGPPRN